MDITVNKLNESFAHIYCELGIAQELSEYFSFFAEGYKYSPKFKQRLWDGKIRLAKILSNGNIELPVGLIPQLGIFADDREYTLEFNYEPEYNEINDTDFMNFVESLNIHSGNKKITPRDYQLEGTKNFLQRKRLVLLSPTSCLDPDTEIDIELDEDMIAYLEN